MENSFLIRRCVSFFPREITRKYCLSSYNNEQELAPIEPVSYFSSISWFVLQNNLEKVAFVRVYLVSQGRFPLLRWNDVISVAAGCQQKETIVWMMLHSFYHARILSHENTGKKSWPKKKKKSLGDPLISATITNRVMYQTSFYSCLLIIFSQVLL